MPTASTMKAEAAISALLVRRGLMKALLQGRIEEGVMDNTHCQQW
jgi:hypothetical protein